MTDRVKSRWPQVGGRSTAAAGLLLAVTLSAWAQQAASPGKIERDVTVPPLTAAREACAVLDGSAAAYAGRGSGEMTLWSGRQPVAFSVTVSSPQESGGEPAAIANFRSGAGSGTDSGGTEFDLLMPHRSYSSVRLQFARHDLTLTATVSAAGNVIGSFVLFDLTGNKLGANTTLSLGERWDSVLHVRLDKPIARSELFGAWVPPSRSEATLFTTVASAQVQSQAAERSGDQSVAQGTASVAEFLVPAGVPVERVVVNVAAEAKDFHRTVLVEASALGTAASARVTGTIQRMHDVRDNLPLRVDDRAIDAVMLNNQSSPMRVRVTIENGTSLPLPIVEVQLQMRQRQLCFPAWPGAEGWRLFYGEPTVRFINLGGHRRSLVLAPDTVSATLGPEQVVADFHPLVSSHRGTAWRLLAGVVAYLVLLCIMVALVLRTAQIPHIKR